MSVQVLRVRFPGLSVAVSVERERHQQEERLRPDNSVKVERPCSDRHFFTVSGVEPTLVKLQI